MEVHSRPEKWLFDKLPKHDFMTKYIAMFLLLLGGTSFVSAQGTLSGVVKDELTGEPLIGATITYAPGKGVVSDIDGHYSLSLDAGNYELKISYVGYNAKTKSINITNGDKKTLNIALQSITLREVSIVADIAKDRETPIAFSTVTPKQIQEELGAQDIPMILNSTPGIYATQQGGGDGDARVNIRGFNQQNIAVMIDGIPVNDMQNRLVYWSNWFGLDMITGNIQVQRGLSASKLALPSIGGTINILTTGIDSKESTKIKQEFGSGNYSRTSVMHNTGKLKNGWGLTVAASYKKGDGLVDATFTEGYFYYLKVEKLLGKHRLSLTGFGAPQEHGQRSYKQEIGQFDRSFARENGVADSVLTGIPEYGRYYNPHWGVYENYSLKGVSENPPPPPFPASADYYEITGRGDLNVVNERLNYYHKPQFVLRDFWQINKKMNLASSAYLSIGNGGGTALNSGSGLGYDTQGRYDLQAIYDGNLQAPDQEFTDFLSIDTAYSLTEIKASKYLRTSRNDHFWTGALSQFNYSINDELTLTAGIDLRYYKGTHYREIYDFVGGDYILNSSNQNEAPNQVLREGDRLYRDEDGLVTWAGGFFQAEYKAGNFNAVLNLTTSTSGFKAIDRYRKKMLDVGDTTLYIGYNDEITYQDQTYNRDSEGLETYETDWKWIPGYSVKAGFNYNLTERMNLFTNLGYLSIAPVFSNVIDQNNDFYEETVNEEVRAIELGYQYASRKFSANINAYYTVWGNRPISRNVLVNYPAGAVNGDIGEDTFAFIRNIDALHRGIEFDAAYIISKKFKLEGLLSVGNWTWESQEEVDYTQSGIVLVDANGDPLKFTIDPKGVKVGDAAQLQAGGSINYTPTRGSYVRIRATYFGNNYSNFNPESSTGVNAGRQSWQIPEYTLFDLHAGYTFYMENKSLRLGVSVFNLLDTFYITDAQNNDTFTRFTNTQNFDAASASVFPGAGRRFNLNVTVEF